MRKLILSARIPRLTAALVAGSLATTVLVPLAQAQQAKKETRKVTKKEAVKKPDKKTRNAARKAYNAAEKAFDAGKYAEAYNDFKQANSLISSPHAEYWMAMSLDKQGKVAEAYAAFKTFFNNPRAEKVGDEKFSSAKAALEKLKKIPGEVSFKTMPMGAAVSVDGQAQMGETPMTVKILAGDHKIEVSAPGYKSQKIDLSLTPGEKKEQAVTLEATATPPPAIAPVTPTATAPPITEPPAQAPRKSKVPAYVTLGIAGAGAIVGTIFGVKALGDKSKYNDHPTNSNADRTERDALIADMSFGVAITLGVTGVVLLLSSGSSSAASESGSARNLPPKATLDVAPYVSLHGGGASARVTF